MKTINKEDVIEILKQCYDPEIPIDLWNLGLIYEITIKDYNINITMSLTTPGCTMGQYMADDIKSPIGGNVVEFASLLQLTGRTSQFSTPETIGEDNEYSFPT